MKTTYDDELKAEIAREAAESSKPATKLDEAVARYQRGEIKGNGTTAKAAGEVVDVVPTAAPDQKRHTVTLLKTAAGMGLDFSLPASERFALAAQAVNRALVAVVEAGAWLTSLKHELPHGAFEAGLAEYGIAPRTAQRLIQQSSFYLSLPEAQRGKLLSLSSRKVLALAGGDFEAASALIERSGASDLEAANVADLLAQLRKSEKQRKDAVEELEGRQSEVKLLRRKLEAASADALTRKRTMPAEVEEIQDEVFVATQKIQLFLEEISRQGLRSQELEGPAAEFSYGIERNVVAALQALHLTTRDMLQRWTDSTGIAADDTTLEPLAMLDRSRLDEVRDLYSRLTHSHEVAVKNRKAERQATSGQRGRGAPLKTGTTLAIDE